MKTNLIKVFYAIIVIIFLIPSTSAEAAILAQPTIYFPDENDECLLEDMMVDWNNCSYSEYYLISLRDLTTNQLLIERKEIYTSQYEIPSSYFTIGHEYKIAIGAVGQGTEKWDEAVFTIIETDYDNVISENEYAPNVIFPEQDIQYDLEDITVEWDICEYADYYLFSFRDITMDQLIINREEVNDESYYISSNNFVSGHTYRVAVASVDDSDTENWTEVEFTVIDNNEYYLSGYIKDGMSKKGLTGVEVTINDSTTRTNSKGYYQISTVAGNYLVSISKDNYANYSFEIELFDDVINNIYLNKSLSVAPSVTAEAVRNNQINLRWDTVAGATIYRVYRATLKYGKYSLIGPATTTLYIDSGLKPERTFWYKVSACNNVGDNMLSKQVSATTPKLTITQPRASTIGKVTIKYGNVTFTSGIDFIKSVIKRKIIDSSSINVDIDGMARSIYKELGYTTFDSQDTMESTIIDKITSKVGITGLQKFVYTTNKLLDNQWASLYDSLGLQRNKYDKYCEGERRYFQVVKIGSEKLTLKLSYGVIDKHTSISETCTGNNMNSTKYRIKIYMNGDMFPTWESDVSTTSDTAKYATVTLNEPGNYYVVVEKDLFEILSPSTVKWDCVISSSSLMQNVVWP